MILFAAGRGELLKRFLTEDGVGTDARFWKLAQSFSALLSRGSDEKRWVDGGVAADDENEGRPIAGRVSPGAQCRRQSHERIGDAKLVQDKR